MSRFGESFVVWNRLVSKENQKSSGKNKHQLDKVAQKWGGGGGGGASAAPKPLPLRGPWPGPSTTSPSSFWMEPQA